MLYFTFLSGHVQMYFLFSIQWFFLVFSYLCGGRTYVYYDYLRQNNYGDIRSEILGLLQVVGTQTCHLFTKITVACGRRFEFVIYVTMHVVPRKHFVKIF